MNYVEHNNKLIFSPGYYLKENIEEGYFTISELEEVLDLNNKDMLSLLNGKLYLTDGIANNLASYLGTSKQLWLNIESSWRKALKQKGESKNEHRNRYQ